MQSFASLVALTAPLFLLVLVGYALSRWGGWPKVASDALSQFVFVIAIPAFLFRLMSDFSKLPPVDARLLIAYFGGLMVTFVVARLVAARLFRMNGVDQSLFGLGTIFSNTVLLGIPLAKITLGEESLPIVSLILVFNSLSLWMLATISVEWARHRDFSVRGLGRTARDVVTNPVVASILAGTIFGFTGIALPGVIDQTLQLMSQSAVPMSLLVLGMGLAEYGIRAGIRPSMAMAALKLFGSPLAVYFIARALALPQREMQTIVMMAGLPVAANVYLMSRHFGALEGPVASSLVLTTLLAAGTIPLLLTWLH